MLLLGNGGVGACTGATTFKMDLFELFKFLKVSGLLRIIGWWEDKSKLHIEFIDSLRFLEWLFTRFPPRLLAYSSAEIFLPDFGRGF